ncbi:MAG: pirin family protein [Alphaproteobacteria bacterium]|nr:pirin family protein [Alphaproteobacteria bacterium]
MTNPVIAVRPLGPPPWPTLDPFLFCVHHLDHYPAGNDRMGPDASLAGHRIGMDFEGKDGWRMYHGDVVPGFPRHPHRGFETVTLARRGLIDHADSLGARARFGQGDAQWMTAGGGIEHSEMFPLLDRTAPNPAELFQIWLNLPASDKMVPAYFTMLWAPTIPRHVFRDAEGRTTEVVTVAGALDGRTPPKGPPNSWASRPDAHVAIWTITLAPGARWTMPAAPEGVQRVLYAFAGASAQVGGAPVTGRAAVQLTPGLPVELVGGPEGSELLLLQGRPIGEPVAHHGPFVMNTREELEQAYADYRRTRFGTWPWGDDAPVHGREPRRFAVHADGRREEPKV